MADHQTTKLTARCLCGAAQYSIDVPNSKLPLSAGFCHCNSCRHVTGTMSFECVEYPADHRGFPPDELQLTKYAFSPRADVYFCSTCGTLLFWKGGQDDFIGVTVGSIENAKEFVKFDHHIFLEDTKDGGMSDFLVSIKGIKLKRMKGHMGGETLPLGWKDEKRKVGNSSENLNASCLCKGVHFRITRPTKESGNQDLDESAKNSGYGMYWLDPETHTRYMADMCACDSCRLSSGNDIMNWANIPVLNLKLSDGSPLALPSTFGTLKAYNHSDRATRYFCGQCGACIFYWSHETPYMLNVAVGILDAEEGARAEKWLWWRPDGMSVPKPVEGLKRDVLVQDVIDAMAAQNRTGTMSDV